MSGSGNGSVALGGTCTTTSDCVSGSTCCGGKCSTPTQCSTDTDCATITGCTSCVNKQCVAPASTPVTKTPKYPTAEKVMAAFIGLLIMILLIIIVGIAIYAFV